MRFDYLLRSQLSRTFIWQRIKVTLPKILRSILSETISLRSNFYPTTILVLSDSWRAISCFAVAVVLFVGLSLKSPAAKSRVNQNARVPSRASAASSSFLIYLRIVVASCTMLVSESNWAFKIMLNINVVKLVSFTWTTHLKSLLNGLD